jgi:hypothetical protein
VGSDGLAEGEGGAEGGGGWDEDVTGRRSSYWDCVLTQQVLGCGEVADGDCAGDEGG